MTEDFLSAMTTDESSTERQLLKFYKNKYNQLLRKYNFLKPHYNKRGRIIKKLKKDKQTLWNVYLEILREYYSIPYIIRRIFK